MAGEKDVSLPFRGLSAWFSCSVNPSTVKLWEQHGGMLAGESEALYLFSDDAFTKDTTRLYNWQKEIMVVQTSWIREVVQDECPVSSVALGRHILLPHFVDLHAKLQPEVQPKMIQTEEVQPKVQPKVVQTEVQPKVQPEVQPKVVQTELQPTQLTRGGITKTKPPAVTPAQYNAVWNKLEQDCLDNPLESIMHMDHLQSSATQTVFDFVLSNPKFKVYRKGK